MEAMSHLFQVMAKRPQPVFVCRRFYGDYCLGNFQATDGHQAVEKAAKHVGYLDADHMFLVAAPGVTFEAKVIEAPK